MKRHGVVAVHGQGANQLRGAFMVEVANGIADSLERRGGTVLRALLPEATPATGTIEVTPPDRGEPHRYEFVEAFWDDAFPPPRPEVVLRWVWRHAWRQVKHTWAALLDPTNAERGGATSVSVSVPLPWAVKWLYVVQLQLLLLVLLIGLVLAMPIALLLWALRMLADTPGLRLFGLWESLIVWARTLDPFMTTVMGDSERYVEHGMWASGARGRVERAALHLLGADVDDIAIVAHSAGCGVAYDALLSPSVIADTLVRDTRKLTLVTVGSAMNRYYLLSAQELTQRNGDRSAFRARFMGALDPRLSRRDADASNQGLMVSDRFFWLDLFARLDPIPAGGVLPALEAASGLDASQIKRRRVINFDNPIDDHWGYFTNDGLVVTRLIRSVSGGEYPWQLPRDPAFAAPAGAAGTEEDRSDHWPYEGARQRVRALAYLQAVRLIVAFAAVAHLALLSRWPWWRDQLTTALQYLNSLATYVFDLLPALGAAWGGGNGALALTAGGLLAVLGPIVLLLAVQRAARNTLFPEL